MSVGAVSAGFSLAEVPTQSIVSLVSEVESAINRDHEIRSVDDPGLRVGHLIHADDIDMAYGVQRLPSDEGPGAAVFGVERDDGLTLFLSGSAEYLLDRRVPTVDAGQSMSAPDAIASLLETVVEEADPDKDAEPEWRDFYAASNLLSVVGRYGLNPMSFTARVLRIRTREEDRLIIGTPLWVALAVPE